MKISFISTVYNEEKTILTLLESILNQSQVPDEVIIVDGGSSDNTRETINSFIEGNKLRNVKVLTKFGNRSVGRNEAIRKAKGGIIAISDAGCVLDKKWLENITEPFRDSSTDVVAGYYKGQAKNILQKCLIPYVLVMPDRVDGKSFLPATRSMAIRKSVWEGLGGFPEEFSHNEDYVFSKRLEKEKKNIVFVKDAVVTWIPPTSIQKAFVMFYRFALGDIEAGLVRKRVILLFVRYILAIGIGISFLVSRNYSLLLLLAIATLLYIIWAVVKNYRYVKDWKAIYYLPFLQFLSDLAVLSGSVRGGFKKHGL